MLKRVLAKLMGLETTEKSHWRKAIERLNLEEEHDQVVKERRREGDEKIRRSQEVLRRIDETSRAEQKEAN